MIDENKLIRKVQAYYGKKVSDHEQTETPDTYQELVDKKVKAEKELKEYKEQMLKENIKNAKKVIDKLDKEQMLKENIKNTKKVIDKLEGTYEMVDHPKHYNNYDVEVVDMMERIWGKNATIQFCEMNAFKYRMRMGTKTGENDSPEVMKNKLLEDFNKEQWYLKKADELKSKLLDKSIDMNQ